MPHFIIECSKNVLDIHPIDHIMQEVYESAESTALFGQGDIKVRIRSYDNFLNGGDQSNFIHVFGNIMEGRTTDQKANLSKVVVAKLVDIFPDVPVISINIREFEKATYYNRNML